MERAFCFDSGPWRSRSEIILRPSCVNSCLAQRRQLFLDQPLMISAAKVGSELIVLKNYSLIVAQAADSICLLDRGICDVGTKAGGAGSTVL